MKSYAGDMLSIAVVVALLVGLVFVAQKGESVPQSTIAEKPPAFTIQALPYDVEALEPYISGRTMTYHYARHHQAYLDKLNKLVEGRDLTGKSLEQLIGETEAGEGDVAVFNNAAQVWNHSFLWKSMKPGGGGEPVGRLMRLIVKTFGSYHEFRRVFAAEAAAQFGSGWVWLIQEGDALKISRTSDADTPLVHGMTPLLVCDVWEHAYYLDYQNRRKDYVEAFLDSLVNWDFAESQLK